MSNCDENVDKDELDNIVRVCKYNAKQIMTASMNAKLCPSCTLVMMVKTLVQTFHENVGGFGEQDIIQLAMAATSEALNIDMEVIHMDSPEKMN